MSYLEEHAKGRERLQALVSRLSDEQLAVKAEDGWTVAAVLAHLAFWDNRALELVKRWKTEGSGASPIDADIINDAMKPLLLAIVGRQAVNLAIQAAEAVDAELSNMPEEVRAEIEALVREVPAGPIDPPE
jgi:uncharacterized damage-inducible protein DinB